MRRHENRAPLEREEELAEIAAVIARAGGGRGTTVIVEAAAGYGKSALLSAVTSAAPERARVLRASGSELEREFAFGAIRQLLDGALVASGGSRPLLEAPLQWLIDPGSDAGAAPARAQAAPAVLHAVHQLAVTLTADGPLVLAVDDLHWVDEPSLRAFAFLARRLDGLPVTFIGTLRPTEPGIAFELLDALRSMPGVVLLGLRSLSSRAIAALVRERIPAAGPALCGAFADQSAGNPLYLRELLAWARLERIVSDADAEAVQRASVPALAERVVRRVRRVAPEAERLAAMMSVLGDGTRLGLAAELAGLGTVLAAEIASRLVEIDVLAADDPFAFAHPVLRRSVYDRLTATQRHAAHAGAAAVLLGADAPAEAVAVHLGRAPAVGSVVTVDVLRRAARAALLRAAPDVAVSLLRRALEERAAQPGRAQLLLELGETEMHLRLPTSLAHLQEAFELAEEPQLRARIAVTLGDLLASVGQWEQSTTVVGTALAQLEECDRDLEVELETLRAAIAAYDPRLIDQFARNRSRYETLIDHPTWAARALAALLASYACIQCESREVVRRFADRALRDGRLLAERNGGWAACQVGPTLVNIGDTDRAAALSRELLELAGASGSVIAEMSGTAIRGMVASTRGDLAAAEADLRTVLELAAPGGLAMWQASLLAMLMEPILERSTLEDIADFADRLELDPVFSQTASGGWLEEVRGRIALVRRDRRRARECLERCASALGPLVYGPTFSSWRSALALCLPAAEHDRASALVGEELRLARQSGSVRAEAVALRAAGLLSPDEAGIERLRESARLLAGTEHRLERARSLVELGAALRRARHRGEAREYLSAGMEAAYRCGADRLVARTREELHAAGARPRRAVHSGPDALTASELRVARLASSGHTNAEIATELYLSPKTIEAHLSHGYRKLGLGGSGARARLADSLRNVPDDGAAADKPRTEHTA